MNYDVKKDKYISTESAVVKITSPKDTVRVDLVLPIQPEQPISKALSGTVLDEKGVPVNEAYVQLYDANMKALVSTQTSQSGMYAIADVNVGGTYFVSAAAENKVAGEAVRVTISERENSIVNFTLKESAISSLGFIEGLIFATERDTFVHGAVISLYKIEKDEKVLVSVTYSNSQGRYMLREVEIGDYIATTSALGFFFKEEAVSIYKEGQKVALNFNLVAEVFATTSTISGIITGTDKAPISGADVILYRVEEDGKVVATAFTTTNDLGLYLFADVPNGSYRVMSNDSVIETVTVAPKVELKAPNTITVGQSFTADISYNNGDLSKVALKSDAPSIVSVDGFKIKGENIGKATITAYLLEDPAVSQSLEITVITQSDGVVPPMPIVQSDFKADNFTVSQKGGNDYISITDIELFPSKTQGYPHVHMGNYVFGIMDGGYITMTADVPVAGKYKATMKYIGAGEREFKMDVNGVDDGTVYYTTVGSGYVEPQNAPAYEFTLSLQAGKNQLKMYCLNGVAPDFHDLKVEKQPVSLVYQAEHATLKGNISIENTLVAGFDQSPENAVEFKTTVPDTNVYDLVVRYVSNGSYTGTVLINNKDTVKEIVFEETASQTISSAKTIKVNLNEGENTIKLS